MPLVPTYSQVYRWNILLLFFAVLLPLLIFGSLAAEVLEKENFVFDGPVLQYLHSHANAFFDALMLFFTRAGSAMILAPFDVIFGLILLQKTKRFQAGFWIVAIGGAGLLNLFAKHFYSRMRPDLWVGAVHETTYSFPSGHAMHSMAVVAALVLLSWRTRWRLPTVILGSVFVAMVGLSRVYFGVHFPSDILAGWVASIAWVTGVHFIFLAYRKARS